MKLRVALLGTSLSVLLLAPGPAQADQPSDLRSCAIGGAIGTKPVCPPPPGKPAANGVRASRSVTRNATVLADPRCLRKAKTICIDKGARAIYAVKNKKVLRAYSARFGRKGEETREGVFTVLWKNRDHVSSIYHAKMPNAMFFSGGQAIHYSADFKRRGYAGASHGCVNMRSKKGSAWLYRWAPVGTRVLITD